MSETPPDRGALPPAGVKVVDFGQYIAGPAVAMILGDLGATVVHVDPRRDRAGTAPPTRR